MSVESVKAEIDKLDAEQRADLLIYLVDGSTDAEDVRDVWNGAIASRVDDIRSGAVEGVPGESVFGRIDEKLQS